ncbi:MAG: hypothetical protein HGA87_01955 [Desulfobulbaceae bacterium]|nr:hypothetical protein [Desulfobulbaceae bacterium]
MYWEKEERWKTFHDFLFAYIKIIFGKEWGEAELKKPEQEQHPIIQWHLKSSRYMQEHKESGREIQSTPMIGAISAWLSLSYNLFLLEHNLAVQDRIIQRLKNKQQFQGALYETYVAAIFIRAGFKIEMEDESDPNTSHGEFVAVASQSEAKYSIEAKARQPFKDNIGIWKQLKKALDKNVTHKRVVFIDVNIPKMIDKMGEIEQQLKDIESLQDAEWKNSPPAYVFITNHAFVYDLEGVQFERMGFAYGFKIDYFKGNTEYASLRDARIARDKHMDMVRLIKSTREQNEIPVTFDGDIPEFAFNKELKEKRLLIGNKYLIPAKDGKEAVGILESATILENEKLAYGSYLFEDGTRGICTCPVTDDEISAYKKYPDTFFGVHRHQGGKTEDPLELFDFFHETYKKTPREKLLEFMKNWPNINEIKKLSDDELSITYCEGLVYSILRDKTQGRTRSSVPADECG